MRSYIDSYLDAIEQDFFKRPGSIAALLQDSRTIIKMQMLHTMRTLLEAYPKDNPDLLSAMDEFVFFTEAAPEALLARGRCLIAAKKWGRAKLDLERVLEKGNEQERVLATKLLQSL